MNNKGENYFHCDSLMGLAFQVHMLAKIPILWRSTRLEEEGIKSKTND